MNKNDSMRHEIPMQQDHSFSEELWEERSKELLNTDRDRLLRWGIPDLTALLNLLYSILQPCIIYKGEKKTKTATRYFNRKLG